MFFLVFSVTCLDKKWHATCQPQAQVISWCHNLELTANALQRDTQEQSPSPPVNITEVTRLQEDSLSKMFYVMLYQSTLWKRIQIHSILSSAQETSRCQKPRAPTCYRVWPWHHEGRGCLRWVWNGSLRWAARRLRWCWCPCWYVGLLLLLLVCPGWGVGWRCCGTVGVFFGHRRAGVGPHALCQAMAPTASQASIFTPLQAGAAAVIVLRGTSDGGWEETKTETGIRAGEEVKWGKKARNMKVMFFVCMNIFLSLSFDYAISTLFTSWFIFIIIACSHWGHL